MTSVDSLFSFVCISKKEDFYAFRNNDNSRFLIICVVIILAFVLSIILYVAYYRMEEMRAFYAAMVPLIMEAAAMAVLAGVVMMGKI